MYPEQSGCFSTLKPCDKTRLYQTITNTQIDKRITVCDAMDSRLRGNDGVFGVRFPSDAGAFRPLRGGVAAKRTGWVSPAGTAEV